MTCGIYKLVFKDTDSVYIGQSKDVDRRFTQHLHSLVTNTAAPKLQEAYNRFGSPTLDILVECEEIELDDLETLAIELYDSFSHGFNATRGGNTSSKLNGEEHGQAKFLNEQVLQCLEMLVEYPNLTYKQISLFTNVSIGIVAAIAQKRAHCWLKGEYPELYEKLELYTDRRKAYNPNRPRVISPDNKIYEVLVIKEFAEQHELHPGCLSRLLKGDRKTHKGWKVYKD